MCPTKMDQSISMQEIYTPLDREIEPSTRLLYGFGQVAEGIKNYGFSTFILFYYNAVLGLSGTLCGLAIGIALVVDAISDPIAGSISDNFRSRWGRRHPFMVGAALPLALAFFGLFAPPADLDSTGLFVWLTSFAIATRLMMTAYHMPHMALGAELTTNFAERTRLVAARQIFGYVGAFVTAAIGFGFFFSDEQGGRMNADAYAPFALVMSVMMVLAIFISVWGTRGEIAFLPKPRPSAISENVLRRFLPDSISAFENRSFKHLFGGVLLIYILIGTEGALSLYMYEFFWALEAGEILLLSLLYPVGLVIGAFFTARLHEAWDKGPTLILGTVGWLLCQIFPVLLRLADVLPENGTSNLIGVLFAIRIIQGILVQQALASFSSMMADIADEHDLATGRRQEGIFFGVVSFSAKAASGAGSVLAGIALDVIGWPAGLGMAGSTATLAPETIRNLGIVYGPMVAIFAIAAPFAYRGYDLNRVRHKQVLEALAVRDEAERAAANSPSSNTTHPRTR